MFKPLKAVLFDFDGTLADTLPMCIEAFHRAIEPLAGRAFTDAEIIATFGPSEEGTIKALIPDRFGEGVERYLHHYAEVHDRCDAMFPGMKEILDELRRKQILIGLITGKGAGSLAITFDRLGIRAYFDAVETGSVEGVVKARCIRSVLEKWQHIGKDEVVYVGDAPSDILACREAGVPVVAAAWAATADSAELLKFSPDEIFTTVEQFKHWIESRL